MAINNVKNTQSLLGDIKDWMNNPKFQPQEQNKWFFGEGLSYYTQLCEVVKVLTYLQENFANEITRATNAEGELDAKIEAETTRATTAEETLTNDLATEVNRAKQSEKTLETNLNAETQRATNKENEIVDNLNSEISRAKAAESTNATNIANEITRAKKAEEVLTTNLSAEYNVYDGEDLIIKYADEIAKYSDEWAWIKARIKAVNFKGLRIHDYIPVKCSNNKVLRMEIAGIDTYYHNGSPEVGHHIDFISKECWDVSVQYNKVNINNGTAEQVVPFMASNLKKFLMSEAGPVPNSTTDMSVTTEVDYTNDGIWHFLPDKLKNVIVEKNFFKVNRYTEGSIRTTDNSDWGWFNLSKLWLPTEKEVYGSSVYEGNSGSYGIFGRQYPCFIGNSRFKGIIGNINARCNWWLLSPYSANSSSFCFVDSAGIANYYSASITYFRVPVCFRVA